LDSAEVREAAIEDAAALAALTSELGYPAMTDDTARRLGRIFERPNQLVLVSCAGGGRPVGWIHVGERALLEGDEGYEILGLVVAASHRRQGRAQRLVAAAEVWVASRGARQLTVRSNIVRPESHPFYERAGYVRVKTQHVYRKPLG
jgi:GNAT superfamily N-acetyltransferase